MNFEVFMQEFSRKLRISLDSVSLKSIRENKSLKIFIDQRMEIEILKHREGIRIRAKLLELKNSGLKEKKEIYQKILKLSTVCLGSLNESFFLNPEKKELYLIRDMFLGCLSVSEMIHEVESYLNAFDAFFEIISGP